MASEARERAIGSTLQSAVGRMTSERRRLEHVAGRLRPNYLVVEIREDVLREKDGPMLLHGLQDSQILIPTRRDLQPDRDFLAERYEIFRKAG